MSEWVGGWVGECMSEWVVGWVRDCNGQKSRQAVQRRRQMS